VTAFGAFVRSAIRWLVATALFLMMLITFLDVLGRYLINRPFTGSAELVQYLMVAFIFLALPVVTLRNEHISISLVESALGPAARKLQRIFISVFSAVVFGVLAARLWSHAVMLANNRDVIGYLNLPVAPAAFLASVFCAITVLVLAAMIALECMGRGGALLAADSDQGGAQHE